VAFVLQRGQDRPKVPLFRSRRKRPKTAPSGTVFELGWLGASTSGDEQLNGGEVVTAHLAKRRRRLDAVAATGDADDDARLDYR
jgi:hypothetical protein